MKNKTLLITAFHSFITKNILNTKVFSTLVSLDDWQIALVVPKSKISFFEEVYGCFNVMVKGVDTESLNHDWSVRFFSRLFFSIQDSHYLHYKKRERLDKRLTWIGQINYLREIVFTKFLSRLVLAHPFWRKCFLLVVKPKEISALFDEVKPDVVFSTDIFDETDVLFEAESRRRGVPLIAMVRSWDNCYSKGVLRVIPDEIIVNNDVLKEEIVAMHQADPKHVFVGGLPQFDHFINEPRTDREKFFSKTGLNLNKKVVLFAPAGAILSDTDWQICEILDRAIKEGEIKKPSQVLIRNHPGHPADLSKVRGSENFIIETPGKVFDNNPKKTEITKDDSQHLADSVYYADVVVYIATTLGLDSLVFDKPQIIIDFDGWERRDYWHSVKRYHDEDHMKKMIACGGVRIASSPKELIKYINDYLNNPSLDQEGRDRAKIQQLYKLDGKSGERIGNFILEKIKELP